MDTLHDISELVLEAQCMSLCSSSDKLLVQFKNSILRIVNQHYFDEFQKRQSDYLFGLSLHAVFIGSSKAEAYIDSVRLELDSLVYPGGFAPSSAQPSGVVGQGTQS